MKTSELIRKINSWGLLTKVERIPNVTYITVRNCLKLDICRLSSKDDSWFDIEIGAGRDDMDEHTRVTLSSIISAYLATPIDEREPEKKYRLEAVRHFSGPIAEKGYVKNVVCKSDYSGFEYSPVPFVFTEKELETMKKNDPVLAPAIDAMKVEVKGDAC